MGRTPDELIELARAGFEAGFASKAAKKRALDALNAAYSKLQDAAYDAVRDFVNKTYPWDKTIHAGRTEADWQKANAIYAANDLPYDLHNVRPIYLPIFARFGGQDQVIKTLVDLRTAIKGAELLPLPDRKVDPKVDLIQRTVAEELERRKALYLEALDLGRLFGGLPVTVNAHWVRPIKAVDHIRHFYYLNGKLTPLLVILAAAQKLEEERKEREAA